MHKECSTNTEKKKWKTKSPASKNKVIVVREEKN